MSVGIEPEVSGCCAATTADGLSGAATETGEADELLGLAELIVDRES